MATPTPIIFSKEDLVFLQQKGFFKSLSEVEEVWKLISSRCVPATNSSQSNHFAFVNVPSLQGGLKSKDTTHFNDAVIAFSKKNGSTQARLILDSLKQRGLKVDFAHSPDALDALDVKSCETKIANSTTLVVVLTADSLKQLEVAFSMTAAQYYYKAVSQVILVHDAGSCLFPGYDEQPPALANLFSEKAVTFLSCYASVGISEIENKIRKEMSQKNKANDENQLQAFQHLLSMYESTDKISVANIQEYLKISAEELENLVKELDQNQDGFVTMEEFSRMFSKSEKFASLFTKQEEHAHHEDLSTRIFLSHKRSSGQAIVGRLYECLKDHYSIFLDSEAKFQIHNLKQIVESTQHFVFVLSAGIFLSKWCLEELKSAVANKKPVTVVRDLAYNLPPSLPAEWSEFEYLIRQPDQLIWVAEYNNSCVDALIKRIGPSDIQVAGASILTSNKRVESLKKEGVLKIPGHLMNCLGATCMKLQELGLTPSVRTLDCRNYVISNEDMTLLQEHNIKFPNLEILQIQEQRNLQTFWNWISSSKCPLEVLEFGFHGAHVTEADLKTVTSLFGNLTEISLNHVDCSKAALLAFFEKFSNLRKFALRYPEAKLNGELVESLARLCPRLESLELAYPEIEGRPFQNASFAFLKNFQCQGIDTWEGSVDVAFDDLAKACPGLTAVSFDCWNPEMETVSPAGYQSLGAGCPNIESLVVCLGDESYLKVLPQFFPKLKKLEIRTGPTDEGLKLVGELSSLEEISLVGDSATDAGLVNLAPILPKLKMLKLDGFVKITEEAFTRLLDQATALDSLVVCGCRVTPASVLSHATKNVSSLEITFNGANEFKLTSEDLQAVQKFPNLKKLLATVAGMSDQTVPQITPLLSIVDELGLQGGQDLTPKGVSQLVTSANKTQYLELRSLKFKEFGVAVTPGTTATVLSKQVNLEFQKKNPDCNVVMYLSS